MVDSNSAPAEPRRDADDDAGSGGRELSEKEHDQAADVSRPNALVVYEVIRAEGEQELERPAAALAFSGLAAGLSMGFSMVAQGILRAHLPDTPWRPLVANLGYTVGFLIVIGGRQQLFTENTLTPVLPFLNKPNLVNLGRVFRLWGIVLASNLVGALLFAAAVGHCAVFDPAVRQQFSWQGHEAMHGSVGLHFLRGIFAGWLLALVVWLLPGAEQSRLMIIVILTYLVGVAGLSHVIAGSVDTLYLVTTGQATVSSYFAQFMIPTLLGNTIGGVTLVAALSFGQVAPEKT